MGRNQHCQFLLVLGRVGNALDEFAMNLIVGQRIVVLRGIVPSGGMGCYSLEMGLGGMLRYQLVSLVSRTCCHITEVDMIAHNLTKILDKTLKDNMFRDAGPTRKTRNRIYAKGTDRIVCIPPFTPSSRAVSPSKGPLKQAIQDAFEDMLGKLLDDLRDLKTEGPGSITLIMFGGGSLVLPDWFLDALKEMDISIVILGGDSKSSVEMPMSHNSGMEFLWQLMDMFFMD